MIGLAKIVLWVVLVSSEPGIETVTPLPAPEPTPTINIQPAHWSDIWPEHLKESAGLIVKCESTYNPQAVGDHGNSLGLFQLWKGWFSAEELQYWYDPIVNSRVALRVYGLRGRFGGPGGWTCADKLGIY